VHATWDMSGLKADGENQSRSAATAANTAAKPLDSACPEWTTVECRPSTRTATDGPGRCAYSYGSEGCSSSWPRAWMNRAARNWLSRRL
jgi:hypothetical protein